MNIPTLKPCRFTSLKEITSWGKDSQFESVRVMGKIISFDTSANSATISNDTVQMKIDIELIPEKELIMRKKYEFLGDIVKVIDS